MKHYNNCRDEKLLVDMRPVLPLELVELDIENFQNQTLRPILKMQHDLLIDILTGQPNFDAVLAYKQKRTVFAERMRIFIQQPHMKGVFLGCVLGSLTQVEMQFYLEKSRECNKRITAMLLQRFVDTFRA